jgi:hypothetical protein
MISCQRTKTRCRESIATRGSQENTAGLRETVTGGPTFLPSAEKRWKSTSLAA